MRALNLDGRLKIGKLRVAGLTTSDLALQVRAADGLITLAPMALSLYGGHYNGTVVLDARNAALETRLTGKLAAVQLGPLLKDLNDRESLSGTAAVDADLRLSGNDPRAMTNSLGGTAKLVVTDGAYQGIDLIYELRRARALLKGKSMPTEGRAKTDFAEFSGRFDIQRGVVRNRDLLAKSPVLRVGGAGSIDLPREVIDYRLDVKLTGSLEGQGGRDMDELEGYLIPVTLSGSLAHPDVGVDLAKLVEHEAKKQLNRQLDKQLNKLLGTDGTSGSGGGTGGESGGGSATDALKKGLGGALKGLFN